MYICVVAISACPSSVCSTRRSTPPSSRYRAWRIGSVPVTQLADDETGFGTRAPAPIDDASAILLLRDDWILRDISTTGPQLVALPFGGSAPSW